MKSISIFLLISIISPTIGFSQTAPLLVGLSIGQGEPYVFEESLQKGLLFDIITFVSSETSIPIQIIYKPPARIRRKFTHGEIDAEVGINPIWRSDEPNISLYTIPFVNNVDSLIYRKNEHKDIFNSANSTIRIGTINSWIYPQLDHLFSSGKLKRYDYNNTFLQLNNLVNKRLDVVIANQLGAAKSS